MFILYGVGLITIGLILKPKPTWLRFFIVSSMMSAGCTFVILGLIGD